MEKPDLILMDIQTLVMDGYDATPHFSALWLPQNCKDLLAGHSHSDAGEIRCPDGLRVGTAGDKEEGTDSDAPQESRRRRPRLGRGHAVLQYVRDETRMPGWRKDAQESAVSPQSVGEIRKRQSASCQAERLVRQ